MPPFAECSNAAVPMQLVLRASNFACVVFKRPACFGVPRRYSCRDVFGTMRMTTEAPAGSETLTWDRGRFDVHLADELAHDMPPAYTAETSDRSCGSLRNIFGFAMSFG